MWGISIGPNPSPGTEDGDAKRRDKRGKGGHASDAGGSPQTGATKGAVGSGGGGKGGGQAGGKGEAPVVDDSPEVTVTRRLRGGYVALHDDYTTVTWFFGCGRLATGETGGRGEGGAWLVGGVARAQITIDVRRKVAVGAGRRR